MFKRYLLIVLGWTCIVLGVAGIFLPVLPTTPFILLSAWAFARSSPRFHAWLLNQRRLGPIVRAWQSGAGIPRQVRNRVIALLWISLSSSALILGRWWLTPVFALMGAAVTVYLLRQPVCDAARDNSVEDRAEPKATGESIDKTRAETRSETTDPTPPETLQAQRDRV